MKQWHYWSLWNCIVPLVVILLIWPLGAVVAEVEHAFHRACATGDLLIFSALLLTGASVELRQNQPRGLVIEAEIAQAFAVVVLIFFGAIKIDLMQNDYFGMTPLPGKIMTYAVCSLSAAISSTIITTFAFWRTTGQMINADNG